MNLYYYMSEYPFNYRREQKLFDFSDFILRSEFPGFLEFFELIKLLNDKLKKKEPTFNLSQKKKLI